MTGDDESSQANRAAEVSMDPVEPATLVRLEAAVRSLRRLDREVFLAIRLDAMSYEQIAACTRLSVRQVEQHFARALREVSAFMRDQPTPRRRWWPF